MKTFDTLVFAATSAALLITTQPTIAGQRYATPPPAVLSADLSSPWILQLKTHPLPSQRSNKRYSAQVSRQIQRRNVVRVNNSGARMGLFDVLHNDRPIRQRYQPQPVQRRVQPAQTRPIALAPQPQVRKKQSQSKRQLDPMYEPQVVFYESNKKPGTIIIDTNQKFLYLVMGNGEARRYGVGVGKPGFEWAGTHKISRKSQWPDWRPPAQMIAREKKKGRILPQFVAGGPENPLGARALYLGSSLYRIHGTNQPWTIGKAVSSGCIRMRNEDVMDLYERVGVGTRVIVS